MTSVNNAITINLLPELIFPEGIAADQREEICKIALESLTNAVSTATFYCTPNTRQRMAAFIRRVFGL